MTFRDDTEALLCVICGGIAPSWTSGATASATLHAPWGEFTVHYHTVCYDEKKVKDALTKMALEAKPEDAEIPPAPEEKEEE